MIGPRHQIDQYGAEQVPCIDKQDTAGGTDPVCTWTSPPADLMNRIWGPVSSGCNYVPGQSDTVWTFGCSAGVDVATSIGENSWKFPSYAGDPNPYNAPGGFTASASAARPTPAIRLGRPRTGGRRAVRGRAQVETGIMLPRGTRLAGATVGVGRLLFDRRGRGELTRRSGKGAARPVTLRLRRAARGRFTGASTGRRRVRVTVRRVDRRGRARLTLNLGAAAFRAPRACHALPATVAIDTPPLYLESRLVIRAGRIRHRLRIEHHVRCVRDARGNVARLAFVRNRSYPARRGLAVSLHGPNRVQPGNVRQVRRGAPQPPWRRRSAGVVAVGDRAQHRDAHDADPRTAPWPGPQDQLPPTGPRGRPDAALRRGRRHRRGRPRGPRPYLCEGWRRSRAGVHRLTRSHDKRRPFDALASRSACPLAPMSDEFARSGRSLAP